jgi:hypothetical protein
VILNQQTRQIEATLVAGRLAYLSGEAGARFLGLSSQPSAPFVPAAKMTTRTPQTQRN